MASTRTYEMKISRLTVDKLGVKLYDRVALVIAELVSNSYDGDAELVEIEAPMGQFLATKNHKTGFVESKDVSIKVTDSGMGMTPQELQNHYLVVGKDRRDTDKGGRGDRSPEHQRRVMGRKGIGKLAPFGVCQFIEVISSGGDRITQTTSGGVEETGYQTAHIIMDRDVILSDVDTKYEPKVGDQDGTLRDRTGTTIVLRGFKYRKVPDTATLAKQLAQRFGISTSNWRIVLKDTTKAVDDPQHKTEVGSLDKSISVMPNSKLSFIGPDNGLGVKQKGADGYSVQSPDGTPHASLEAGFEHEGAFYPITGWIGYSKEPYKDDLMAGVRVYCRGKIASQTSVFNLKAGFTGEHSVRSYLVGAIHAEWLDEAEDLIHTDRRDILWSHELGQAFQAWGQQVVKVLGNITRDPLRLQTWELFQKTGNLRARVEDAFPIKDHESIRENAYAIAKQLGKAIRAEEAMDKSIVTPLIDLSVMLAPHMTLDTMLRNASDEAGTPLHALGNILRTARIAELSSFGQIAKKRIDVIERLRNLKDTEGTDEEKLQKLIEGAPWLINPRWAPITQNQSLSTLKTELPKYFKKKHGINISLRDIKKNGKRPDFVLSAHDRRFRVVEIKRPDHKFSDSEFERLHNYYVAFDDFVSNPGHTEVLSEFNDFHITLICDDINLKDTRNEQLLKTYKANGRLTHMTWMDFLAATEQHHRAFLDEATRQRRIDGGDE